MSETELKFAKRAIAQIAQMGGEHTRLLLEYIKLFSSKDKPLSLEETFEILVETANFWADYPAEFWQKAVQKLLSEKVSGSLKTPLDSHDLLLEELEIVQSFQNTESESTAETAPIVAPSAVAREPPEPFISPSPEQKQARHELNQSMIKKLNCKIFS